MLNSPIGTMTKGHYVAVIRETEHGDSWIYVNDDDVHQAFPTASLNDKDVNKALGLPGDPYAFVYKRVNLTPLDTLLRIQADPLPPTVDPEPPSQSTVDSEPPSPPTLPQSLITSMQIAVTDSLYSKATEDSSTSQELEEVREQQKKESEPLEKSS